MNIKELREKTEQELHKLLKLHREQVRDLRFKVAAKQHKNVRELRDEKRTVAKILTILKEKHVVRSLGQKSTKSRDTK